MFTKQQYETYFETEITEPRFNRFMLMAITKINNWCSMAPMNEEQFLLIPENEQQIYQMVVFECINWLDTNSDSMNSGIITSSISVGDVSESYVVTIDDRDNWFVSLIDLLIPLGWCYSGIDNCGCDCSC